MSEHEHVRELLALAAAGALEEEERRRVDAHLSACEACRTELKVWEALASDLGRLPEVAVPPYLPARTGARVRTELAEAAERRREAAMLVLAILLAWALGAATWFGARLIGGPVFAGIYVLAACVTSALAAALLGYRRGAQSGERPPHPASGGRAGRLCSEETFTLGFPGEEEL